MSSSRSNASARNRRASDNKPFPPNPQGNSQPLPLQSPQQGVVKMTISDAIALITLRLGRVETILQNLPVDDFGTTTSSDFNSVNYNSSSLSSSSSSSSIDENEYQMLIGDILQRLDALEQSAVISSKRVNETVSNLTVKYDEIGTLNTTVSILVEKYEEIGTLNTSVSILAEKYEELTERLESYIEDHQTRQEEQQHDLQPTQPYDDEVIEKEIEAEIYNNNNNNNNNVIISDDNDDHNDNGDSHQNNPCLA